MNDVDSFLPILYDKEQIMPLKVHNKTRNIILNYILTIHNDISRKYYDKDDIDYATLEMLQLAIMYMDVFLSAKSIGDNVGDSIRVDPLNLGAACYVLAYKYESDENTWSATDHITTKYGIDTRSQTVCIEKVILKLLDYKANVVTPLAFISEFMYECGETNIKKKLEVGILSTKIMVTDFYWSSSKIAVISLVLCMNCVKYLGQITNINDILKNSNRHLETIETNWQEFIDEFDHSKIFDNAKL